MSCWLTARQIPGHTGERRIWFALSVLLLLLGINKQLDLQSALTEIGRALAHYQHWYEKRQTVQLAFIVTASIVGVVALLTLFIWSYRSAAATRVALLGTALIVSYVVIRAASFHHVDRFIGRTVLGLRWNWIIEMGGIAVVILASFWRRGRLMS